jgi:hypothetical protein
MSTPAIHPPRPAHVFAYGSFAVMVTGWLAFAYALVASQHTLADVWAWVVDLPLVLELAVWLVGFPFLLGLAIWDASWDETVRVVAIAGVAVAYSLMFLPREPKR